MISQSLKSVRVFHKVSQTELAEYLGLSKSHISELESGKKNATMSVLDKYSNNFDIPKSLLFQLSEALDGNENIPKHKRMLAKIVKWIYDD